MNRADDSNNNTQDTTTSSQTEEQTPPSIVGLASSSEDLSTLVTALQAADLVDTLQGEGPFTVFAPTNDAFAALPAGTLDTLLLPENKDDLAAVLTYHVVSGEVMSSDLSDGQVITTVQGGTLTVAIRDGMVYLIDGAGNEARVVTADLDASNGVVHVIDGVLLQ
jgi:uncharacterized surface protein with fasciclin (FAS1) repeats